MTRRRLLIVGSRRGALAAALRLQLEVSFLADTASGNRAWQQAPLHERVDLARRGDVLAAGGRLAEVGPPDAIVAVTERAVLAAAWLRAALGVPGLDVPGALRCTDKRAMKLAARAAGLATARFATVDGGTSPESLVATLGLPLVLKPPVGSGSRGQVLAHSASDVAYALRREHVLAERFVEGTEMSVEAFVEDGRILFLNPTEYLVPLHANVVPAALDPAERARVQACVEGALAALGVRQGIAHVEVFRTPDGVVFGELAARPPGGRIMRLLRRAWGFDPWETHLRLELGLPVPSFPDAPRRTAGVWILHPGAGRLVEVRGLAEARAVPGVRRIVLRVRPGDRIARRIGSGQDVGSITAEGKDREAVVTALREAHARLELVLAEGGS